MADFTSVVSTGLAKGAYSRSTSLESPMGAGEIERTPSTFGEMVRGATADAVQTVRSSEQAITQGLTGDLDTQQIVEATVALETTVQVAVSVRDRFVEAYQEVLRMPV